MFILSTMAMKYAGSIGRAIVMIRLILRKNLGLRGENGQQESIRKDKGIL